MLQLQCWSVPANGMRHAQPETVHRPVQWNVGKCLTVSLVGRAATTVELMTTVVANVYTSIDLLHSAFLYPKTLWNVQQCVVGLKLWPLKISVLRDPLYLKRKMFNVYSNGDKHLRLINHFGVLILLRTVNVMLLIVTYHPHCPSCRGLCCQVCRLSCASHEALVLCTTNLLSFHVSFLASRLSSLHCRS